MRAARPIAIAAAMAITTFLIALAPVPGARADDTSRERARRLVIAQTSMGAPDPPNAAGPRQDFVPPGQPTPDDGSAPGEPDGTGDVPWGAIGFTADGSWSSAWKMASKGDAEATVAKKCAQFGRGGCEVVSFSGTQCAALATFIGAYGRKRWQLSFTSGGDTYPDAQRNALARCNADERTRGNCQFRTAACGDGR